MASCADVPSCGRDGALTSGRILAPVADRIDVALAQAPPAAPHERAVSARDRA